MKQTSLARLARWVTPVTWRLQWSLGRVDRAYGPLVADAEKINDQDEAQKIRCEWAHYREEIEEQREGIATERLVRQAQRLEIPIPPRLFPAGSDEGEHWVLGRVTGTYYLKDEARWGLLNKIRAEKNERRTPFITWITLLIGLVGALTGLVSVLHELGWGPR